MTRGTAAGRFVRPSVHRTRCQDALVRSDYRRPRRRHQPLPFAGRRCRRNALSPCCWSAVSTTAHGSRPPCPRTSHR